MRKFVFFNAIVAALGGFLFGFDTAVISGAEQDIQKLWGLSDLTHGMAVAIALYGTVVGSLVAGYPSQLIGRKKTLIIVGLFYLISALGSALAADVYSFMAYRFLGGLGVGVASVTAPMYISEISPAKFRGRLVALFQFNIVFGILVAFTSNYFLEGSSENDWRWMLGVEAFPALIYSILVNFIPESPRWLLLHKGNEEAAKTILTRMDPENVNESIQAIKASVISVREKLFSNKFRKPVMLVFLFALFNQTSGINAIIYFAPRIFNAAGLTTESSFLSTTGIGFINLVFTVLGMSVIDKAGRKTLMYVGSVGLTISLLLISVYISKDFEEIYLFFFIYIAFFALSQGAVIWVFISEIFPNTVRAYGQSFGSFTHWMFAAIITNVFPFFANLFIDNQGPIFGFFSMMMFLQLIFVWKVMPETKGLSLEKIQKRLGIE